MMYDLQLKIYMGTFLFFGLAFLLSGDPIWGVAALLADVNIWLGLIHEELEAKNK